MDSEKRVAFVGLGSMGLAMATNLAKHLAATVSEGLLVFNRDPSKATPLVENPDLKCTLMHSLEEVAQQADIVFTMLAEDGAVKSVAGALLAAPSKRVSMLVDCSTVLPATTSELSQTAAQAGVSYSAAPVIGRPDAAAAAKLLILAAGPAPTLEVITPLLGAMGRRTLTISTEDASRAHALKLVANFHIVSVLELLAEGMTFAEKSGISRQSYMELIEEAFPAPIIVGYAGRLSRDEFAAGQGFTVQLGLKDVGHMQRQAQAVGMTSGLPLADLAHRHLSEAAQEGHAQADWSALALPVRKAAGL